jgi:hypothetical protein
MKMEESPNATADGPGPSLSISRQNIENLLPNSPSQCQKIATAFEGTECKSTTRKPIRNNLIISSQTAVRVLLQYSRLRLQSKNLESRDLKVCSSILTAKGEPGVWRSAPGIIR